MVKKYKKTRRLLIYMKLVLSPSLSDVPIHNITWFILTLYTYDENKTHENVPLMTATNPSHAANLASTDIPYSDKF